MTRIAICPKCNKEHRITRNLAKFFYCCGIRWLIDNHLKFQTEGKVHKKSEVEKVEASPNSDEFIEIEVDKNE